MNRVTATGKIGVPWRSFLLCATLPVLIPILYYLHLGQSILRTGANPFDTPETAALARRAEMFIRLLFNGTMLGEVEVSLALSLLTCWAVYARLTTSTSLLTRVIGDIGLGIAFFVAPWLSSSVGFVEFPRGSPLDGWVMGSWWRNILPSIPAVVGGLVFYAVLTKPGHVREAA